MDNESCSSSSRYPKPAGYPSIDDDDELSPTIRWKSGKKVDQKLLNLLTSYFQELYLKRNDFFKKVFSGDVYDYFVELFNKIGAGLSSDNIQDQKASPKYGLQTRSLSFGSSETRLDWFRVKIPDVIVVQPDDASLPKSPK